MEVIDEDEEFKKEPDRFPSVHCWNCNHYYEIRYFPIKEPGKYDSQICPKCGKYNNEL